MATVAVSENVTSEFRMNTAPANFQQSLPEGFLELLAPFHKRFAPRQAELLEDRRCTLSDSLSGDKPAHHYPGPAVRNGWRIDLPEWCQDQRNQMTGPADDAELVVKMLNSGAPGVMLDLEDSTVNEWPNLVQGIKNILAALTGQLAYSDLKRNKTVGIEKSGTVIFTRARGLHL